MRTTVGVDLGDRNVCLSYLEVVEYNSSVTNWSRCTANTMANGKDFFLELRKQVTSLRQGENVAGG